MKPKISVLMPVYNGEKFLTEAIDSVLNQSFKNFELIIVNDGSTDGSAEIIKRYNDNRIVVITHKKNMGLVYSLNEGVSLCKSEYLARMDGDDISEKNRFKTQIEYLNDHTEVGLCGTWAKSINEAGIIVDYMIPPNNLLSRYNFWKPGVIIHPTLMIRTELLKKYGYGNQYDRAEDYDLWMRMGKDGVVIRNIPIFLYRYRINPNGISNSNRAEQEESSFRAFKDSFSSVCLNIEEYRSLVCFNFRLNVSKRYELLNKLKLETDYPVWFAIIDNINYLFRKYFA